MSVADEYWVLRYEPGVALMDVVAGVTATTCVLPVPYCVIVICEPIGKATDAFVGTLTVFAVLVMFISIILFLSVKART